MVSISASSLGYIRSGCEPQVGGHGPLSVIQRDESHTTDNSFIYVEGCGDVPQVGAPHVSDGQRVPYFGR